MINTSIVKGRLVEDPKLTFTSSNKPVCNTVIAVPSKSKDADGKRRTGFVDITVWGQRAIRFCERGSKGRLVTIEGSLDTRNNTDENGIKRKNTWITVDNFDYDYDSRKDGKNKDFQDEPDYSNVEDAHPSVENTAFESTKRSPLAVNEDELPF